jgi:hypothetical protein
LLDILPTPPSTSLKRRLLVVDESLQLPRPVDAEAINQSGGLPSATVFAQVPPFTRAFRSNSDRLMLVL